MGIKRQSPGKWQVFSETGVGDGYKLHTYTPGTTDDKLTHTNKDGSADNTNPVIFDARGEADIWFDGTYDLKLVDANDTLIWTLSDFGAGEGQVNYGNYNLITDGGFEDDTNGDGTPDQWDVTEYPTGGSGAGVVVIDTTDQIEGAQSLKFTSVGDGGGYAVSNFFNVREGGQIACAWMMKSTAADVRNVVELIWYTNAQVQISTSSIYDDSTTNPTSWTQKSASATPVSTARYAKIRIYGCHSSDATTGDTWFDAVQVVSDTVFGDLTVVNDLTVGNDASIGNDLTVTGDTTVSGTLTQKVGSDVASATELTLGDGNYFDVTGTTTITSIATKGAGTGIVLQFDGVLTLTHHATNLILPGGVNITTAAGDIIALYEYATGDWRFVSYIQGSGGLVVSGTLDVAERLEVGATSETDWNSAHRSIQFGHSGALFGRDSALQSGSMNNARVTGADYTTAKYITANYATAHVQRETGHHLLVAASGAEDAAITWITALKANPDGTVLFPNGLLFGSDTAAANTLDDYEEGTWTPGISDGTNAVTLGTAVGSYTKIGRAVTAQFACTATSLGSASGGLTLTGLPFASSSVANSFGAVNVADAGELNIAAGDSLGGRVKVNATEATLVLFSVVTGAENFTDVHLSADGFIRGVATYHV